MFKLRGKWLGVVLSLVLCLALVFSVVGVVATGSASADEEGRDYPVMRPDRETLEEWIEAYNSAPRAYIEPEGFQVPSRRGSLSLLDHLEYTPSERDQGSCGNCWAWAGTGCLGVALDVQEGMKDRLSVQYINSCEYDVIGKTCCTGGWLSDVADFYDPGGAGTGQCIPWSNTNAYWQDGDESCDTLCGSISESPNYPITSINEATIPTQTVDKATAIANIKYQLDSDKAVWFGFFMPNLSAWSDFCSFWSANGEEAVYEMDKYNDDDYVSAYGHAVLCVGYNDEPGDRYWIMLNSWGTTTNRTNGLFRINMDMAYDCTYTGFGMYAFYWQNLDVTFGDMSQPDIDISRTSFEKTLPPGTTENYTLTIGNDGDATLTYDISDYETTGFAVPAGVEVPELSQGEVKGRIELIELNPSEPMSFAEPLLPFGGVQEEIAYDDGSAENALAFYDAGGEFAVRFTPSSYPVSLQTARICLWVDGWTDGPDDDHEEFAVEGYDDDGAGGAPGTQLGTTVYTTATDWGWWDVDILGLGVTIIEGDFYIAYKQLSDLPDCEALCADTDATDGRSWYWDSGWGPVTDLGYGEMDWMIRCVVEEADCSWLNENPKSGSIGLGSSDNITVTIDTTGLAPGDYSADIVIANNDPDENPTTVPVTLHVTPMVATNAATLVEETTATLNGTISNDGGEACQYRFEYDTNSGEPYAYSTNWTGSKITGESFSEAISSLDEGTKYYFRAQAKNSAGTASGSELTLLTKPDAPTSFDATIAGTAQIDLSWTKGDGAQKTKIQRKEGGYPSDKDDGTQVYFGTGTSTPDMGLTPGTTYYYRAWSYVSGSEQWSDNYAEDWATTTAGAEPVITVSPPSFEKTLPPGKTENYTLTIGNDGNATLTYAISDRVTMAPSATPGIEDPGAGWPRQLNGLVGGFDIATSRWIDTTSAASSTWSTNGPYGGYVNSLAMAEANPNVIYAGTESGLFRTADAGATWTKTNFPETRARVVQVAADNPGIVYAGTDDGIYKTGDGGSTWTHKGLSGARVNAIAIDSTNSSVLYVATGEWEHLESDVGVYKSIDGGDNWEKRLYKTDISNGLAVYTVLIDSDNPQTVYAGVDGWTKQLYKSTDGGVTWVGKKVVGTGYDVVALAMTPTGYSPATIYAIVPASAVYRSIDRGETWESTGTPWISPASPWALAVDNNDPDVVYVGTHYYLGCLYKSPDGGDTWSIKTYGLPPDCPSSIVIDPRDSDVYAGLSEGGVYKSTDGAESWNPSSQGMDNAVIDGLAVHPTSSDTVFAAVEGDGHYLATTTNYGTSWDYLLDSPTKLGAVAVDPQNPSTIFAGDDYEYAYSYVYIHKSTDEGQSWSDTELCYRSGVELGVSDIWVNPGDSSIILAAVAGFGGDNGGVYRSTNGGATWLRTYTFWATALASDPGNPGIIYLGTARNGYVFQSTDGGSSWTNISPSAEWVLEVRDIEVDLNSEVYAATDEGLLKWDGAAWTNSTGLPTDDITALAIDRDTSPGTVYVGTGEDGVFVSQDGGNTWMPFNEGLGNLFITKLAISDGQPRMLYAGTEYGGVYSCLIAAEDCPWLCESLTSGSVAPYSSKPITVSIDTTGLAAGDYGADIVIANNDPDENPTIVPLTLHVSEVPPVEPGITVSRPSFEKTLPPGTTENYTLTIGNDGEASLTYTISDRETTGGSSGSAPPGTSPQPPPAADGSSAVALPNHEEEHGTEQVFEQGDTLEELRDKIEQNGYNFTVDHNWVYDMSPEEKEKFFSRHDSGLPEVVDASDDIGPLAGQLGKKLLPSQFDWRDYAGHSYIGDIGNQGVCGSCYAFGACAAAEGTYNFANGLYDGNCSDFSESFIIWCLGDLPEYEPHFYGCDGSDYDYMELTALTAEGVCSEADFPYQTSDGCGDHWDDPRITFDSWHRIPCGDIDAIKTAIMTYGPVDASVYVTGAFQAYESDIYEDTNTTCDGDPCYYTTTDHIVALVGWDDNGGAESNGYWILRNSWGSDDWGEDGYMRIKYRSARVACEACYLVYGGGGDCAWLSESPTSGSVAPAGSAEITVSINTTSLAAGDYNADIVIDNNDPDKNPTIVPVTLHVVLPAPDLIISEKSEEWIDFEAGTYNITYAVTNQGDAAAGASETRIYIDAGSYDEHYSCPALDPGVSDTKTVGPYTMSGTSDTIEVCADVHTAVAESDEDNNCLENTWGTLITGITTEVNCDILPSVSVQLFDADGVTPIGAPATSDGSGNYTLAASISEIGTYKVVASKTEYRDESQTIDITELGQEYEVNFRGDTGLVPDKPDASYAMDCVHYWLFPPGPECGLSASKAMDVIHAWLFPV